jgi:hypothetical protein
MFDLRPHDLARDDIDHRIAEAERHRLSEYVLRLARARRAQRRLERRVATTQARLRSLS